MGDVQVRADYCFSIQGLLKWIQIIFSAVVLSLLLWDSMYRGYYIQSYLHEGEDYTVFVASFAIAVIVILLALLFLNCHNGPLRALKMGHVALVFYLFLMLLWLAAAAVEVWVASRYRRWFGFYNEMFSRRAAAAAFSFANVFVNGFSLFYGRYNGP